MSEVEKPWTYWMALPLVVTAGLALLAFIAVYLKKVVEPGVLRREALAAGAAKRLPPPGARAPLAAHQADRALGAGPSSSPAPRPAAAEPAAAEPASKELARPPR
ncbi:MAG TPA: hypothetical protein VM390_05295 [Acidimicrobiales bacterium]|nr:hypothetical protein [Acidimicrobiales bacterium]